MLPPIADSCSLCCLCCLRLPIQLPPAAYATSDCRFSRLLLFMLPPIADSAAFCSPYAPSDCRFSRPLLPLRCLRLSIASLHPRGDRRHSIFSLRIPFLHRCDPEEWLCLVSDPNGPISRIYSFFPHILRGQSHHGGVPSGSNQSPNPSGMARLGPRLARVLIRYSADISFRSDIVQV